MGDNLTVEQIKCKIYVTPKELNEEFNKSVESGKATDKLILLFTKIAKHFSQKFEYKNKCDKDACVNYATAEAWQKWNKYNSEVSDNIFSFYTTMISNDLKLHYNQITRGKSRNISIESLYSNTEN